MKLLPRFSKVEEWLHWLENLHPTKIDLTLDRAKKALTNIGLDEKKFPSIVIAGTNGKGSSVAFLEGIYFEAGYKVGSFTSPHISCFNERIRINKEQIKDSDLINVFSLIDVARKEVSLSYFEYSFIAALYYFVIENIDIALFEVGLGGRLDVVNSIDHDLSLITSIDLDHQSWLGDDRDSIGLEKAGVMRPKKPSVISDRNPPKSILEYAQNIKAVLHRIGSSFDYTRKENYWDYFSDNDVIHSIDYPSFGADIQLDNASGSIAAAKIMSNSLPINKIDIKKGISRTKIKGRIDKYHINGVDWLFDVAHNPASTKILAQKLKSIPNKGKVIAIFSMLRDKDIKSSIANLIPYIDEWNFVALEGDRSCSSKDIIKNLSNFDITISSHSSVDLAYSVIEPTAKKGDLVVIFGSFRIVAPVMTILGL